MKTTLLSAVLCCPAAAWASFPADAAGRLALPAAERSAVELAVRVEPGGFSKVEDRRLGIDLDALDGPGGVLRFRGEAGGRRVEWSAKKKIRFENGERVESYALSGDGLDAALEPASAGRSEFRLEGTLSGPPGRPLPLAVRFLPETGGEATEFLIRAAGFGLRTRSRAGRSIISGDFAPDSFDATRLAAVGASLALIRLDPPTRRERRSGP